MQKKRLFVAATLLVGSLLSSLAVEAKVWRVNNNTGVSADFSQLTTAFASAAVVQGDTIYLEPSATPYNAAGLGGRSLTIIGPGYLLNDANSNPGLQATSYSTAYVNGLYMDSLASGSVFMGFSATFNLHPQVDNITITRCNGTIQGDFNGYVAGCVINNLILNQSFLSISMNGAFRLDNLKVTNCLLTNFIGLPNVNNALIRNNIIENGTLQTTNSYITNNILVNGSLSVTNSVVRYNISLLNNLPAGDNNKNNIQYSDLFVGGNSRDGQYILKTGSVAKNAGEPLNNVTPDAGMFGTEDPYRLSGIPPIPTIYSLSVPTSVPSTATTMNITFSTRSNN